MKKSSDSTSTAEPDDLISIALIEDNRVVREGLTDLLNEVSGLRVLHAAAEWDGAVVQRVQPHVLLLDSGLENGDSLEIARSAKEDLPDCRVIVMDVLPSDEDIRDFVAEGAAGFIVKEASVDDLTETIKAVAAGARVLPTGVTNALFSQIASHAVAWRGAHAVEDIRLTAREREVLDQIAEGLSNKAIAGRLHISTHTVKSHVRNVMEKLMLHTRLQLAAWAHHEDER